jgi:hypothetical protein
MRINPRKFVIATMLTAMAGMTGLTAAGTASASTAQPQVSGFRCTNTDDPSFSIMNIKSEDYLQGYGGAGDQYLLEPSEQGVVFYFCPEDGTTIGGVSYYYYDDSDALCLTANINTNAAYEANCGEYPASQEWHYYLGADKEGTLENYYTSACIWFTGQPPEPTDPVNIGGCTRNQNTLLREIGD